MTAVTVTISGTTFTEFDYSPSQTYDTTGFQDFLRSLQRRKVGNGVSYTGVTDNEEVIHRLLRDYRRLRKAAAEAGFDVTPYEEY